MKIVIVKTSEGKKFIPPTYVLGILHDWGYVELTNIDVEIKTNYSSVGIEYQLVDCVFSYPKNEIVSRTSFRDIDTCGKSDLTY